MIMQKAYTLIELLVVLGIIAMLTLLGLPAFSRYQHVTEFTQKSEEVKELLNQAYAMALAPTDTKISNYAVLSAAGSKKYGLYSCADTYGGTYCDTLVSEVALTADEVVQIGNPPPTGFMFVCPTKFDNGKLPTCTTGTLSSEITSFRDDYFYPAKTADFSLSTGSMFKITAVLN